MKQQQTTWERKENQILTKGNCSNAPWLFLTVCELLAEKDQMVISNRRLRRNVKDFSIKSENNSPPDGRYDLQIGCSMYWTLLKKALHLSVNVFGTKVLTGDTIFTFPTGVGTAFLPGHPSHAKVKPLARSAKEYLYFSIILRPWVMVQPQESNPGPPALQSSALPTELILPRRL